VRQEVSVLAERATAGGGETLERRLRARVNPTQPIALPGQGSTLERWRAFADVARTDLSLVKLFESHHDALAILDELACAAGDAGTLWAVWAAESGPRLQLVADGDGVRLCGRKAWCSGASFIDRALVTAWNGDDGPFLASVGLRDASVRVVDNGWHAIGMADTRSFDVEFRHTPAACVGRARDYLQRPGFWHGAAGVAACWYGGACALAEEFALHLDSSRADPLRDWHLGEVDLALHGAAALLREAAMYIDRFPRADARDIALRARAAADGCAQAVIRHAGNALGATAYCRNRRFARFASDLPVFIRQSHAERDLASMGARGPLLAQGWEL
jgi:hypothetical protein